MCALCFYFVFANYAIGLQTYYTGASTTTTDPVHGVVALIGRFSVRFQPIRGEAVSASPGVWITRLGMLASSVFPGLRLRPAIGRFAELCEEFSAAP